jgi:hypothetical protein
VTHFEIIKKAEKIQAHYFDVSAKEDIQVQKSFEKLVSVQHGKRKSTKSKSISLLSIFKSTVQEDEQPVYISKNFYNPDE